MIVSFRQTYGNDRLELIDILFKDLKLIEFLNKLDLNIFSFHNCSDETVQYALSKISSGLIKNVKIIRYDDIYYGQCIKKLKEYLYEIKATHFVFTQDDSFSVSGDVNYDEILSFALSHEKEFYLDFCLTPQLVQNNKTSDYIYPPVVFNGSNFKIYEYDTSIHLNNREFALNDFPYICTVDMVDVIYDSIYVKITNIWHAEKYIGKKFRTYSLKRLLIDNKLFRNYNILGRTIRNKRNELKKLKLKKFID